MKYLSNIKPKHVKVAIAVAAVVVALVASGLALSRKANSPESNEVAAIALSQTPKIDSETVVIEQNKDVLAGLPDPYSAIVIDTEKLKSGDKETINKYFGESETFTAEAVSDRVYATVLNFVSQEIQSDNSVKVVVHICSVDYPTMNSDYNEAEKVQLGRFEADSEAGSIGDKTEETYKELAKKEVTRKLIEGKYKKCYNIEVIVKADSTVTPSEVFKQAITGNWYSGTGEKLASVDCIVNNNEAMKEQK